MAQITECISVSKAKAQAASGVDSGGGGGGVNGIAVAPVWTADKVRIRHMIIVVVWCMWGEKPPCRSCVDSFYLYSVWWFCMLNKLRTWVTFIVPD